MNYCKKNIKNKKILEKINCLIPSTTENQFTLELLLAKMRIDYNLNLSSYDDETDYWIDNYSLKELKVIVRDMEDKIVEDSKNFLEKERLFRYSSISPKCLVKEIYKINGIDLKQSSNLNKQEGPDSIRYYYDKDMVNLIDSYSFDELKDIVDVAKIKISDAIKKDKLFEKSLIPTECLVKEIYRMNNLNFNSNDSLIEYVDSSSKKYYFDQDIFYLFENYSFDELKIMVDNAEMKIIDDKVKKADEIIKYGHKPYNDSQNEHPDDKTYGEKVYHAKELQHKRLGPNSHYKRCPLCKKLVNKSSDSCKYCHHKFNNE